MTKPIYRKFIYAILLFVSFATIIPPIAQAQEYRKLRYESGGFVTVPIISDTQNQRVNCIVYDDVDFISGTARSSKPDGECDQGMFPTLVSTAYRGLSGDQTIYVDGENIEKISFSPGVTNQVLASAGNFYYNPPIERATVYAQRTLREMGEKLNIVEPAMAQIEDSTVYFPGRGYDILKPVQGFWSMNRNIAYGLLILIVLYNAFVILLGQKEQGFTPMKSLPNLILSLFLITFSYPISGAFIDLMSLGANTVQSILMSTPGSPGYNTIWNGTIQFNQEGVPYVLKSEFQSDVQDGVEDITGTDMGREFILEPIEGKYGVQIDDPLVSTWLVFGSSQKALTKEDLQSISLLPDQAFINTAGPIGGLVGALRGIGNLFGGEVGDVGSSLGATILNLVFAVTAFIASIKIWFTLLKSYLVLIFYPTISPFLFLGTAIPSMTQKIIQDYVNTLLGAVLSFLVVYAIFLVILIITYEPIIDGFNYFIPPLLGYDSNDVVGIGGHLIRMLMAYGLFLITPQAAESVANLKWDFMSFGNIASTGLKETGGTMANISNMIRQFTTKENEKRYPS
jgi:hypothetical protein